MIQKVNLAEKFGLFDDHWHPRIVADLNGQQVKVAKLLGPFEWHHHADEDELFLVLRGRLRIELRDGIVELEPGEFAVVPRGVEHRPVADEEVHIVLFEPAATRHTGNIRTARTRDHLERL